MIARLPVTREAGGKLPDNFAPSPDFFQQQLAPIRGDRASIELSDNLPRPAGLKFELFLPALCLGRVKNQLPDFILSHVSMDELREVVLEEIRARGARIDCLRSASPA